jgi:formate-dependent nitrite reductase cytochrome c552 subunit
MNDKGENLMRKNILFIGVLVGVLALAALTAYSQEDIEFVEDSGFASSMRPKPTFMHDEHNEKAGIEECNECHHVYEDGKLVEDESSEDQECSECHGAEGDEFPMELVRRYHLNCRGCHQAAKAGPVACGECHAKAP